MPPNEPNPQPDTGTVAESVDSDASDGAIVSPPSLPAADLPPELAATNKYIDVRELGRGGMGVVYLARNALMHRLEVLKVVNRTELDSAGATDRFLREIRSAARLKHANVVGAHSAEQFGNLLVFVMEYVPGEDLSKVLAARGPLPVANACYYAYQAALGLQHAHERGMVHRDVKPSNLILTREGKKPIVKVLDFGLAKAVGEKGLDPTLTGKGAMLGTPAYMSPEQIRDAAKADIRSDIYSLGCTLYHFLAGRPPFEGTSLYALFEAHDRDAIPRLDAVQKDVPKELADVVVRMMAKSPAERYQTPGDVASALKPFFKRGAGINPPPVKVVPPLPVGPPFGIQETFADLSAAETQTGNKSKPLPTPVRERTRTPLLAGRVLFGVAILGLGLAYAAGAFRGKPVSNSTNSTNLGSAQSNPDPLRPQPTGSGSKESPGGEIRIVPPDPKPGEERSFEIAPGVKMIFCWIPPGTATLGSPLNEEDREKDEMEHSFTTTGYWLAKFAVTQVEWAAVMGHNPSEFDGKKANMAKGMETARFPVESVSWSDCQEFVGKLNSRGNALNVFNRPGRFVLPNEDEWEYACRGGKGNLSPFYFGNSLNGMKANCDGSRPYGTTMKGPHFERPTPVGNYNSTSPHPWGLCDMTGNVWQWCENMFGLEQKIRTMRGGSFSNMAKYCRSACRSKDMSDTRNFDLGCRVCFRPDDAPPANAAAAATPPAPTTEPKPGEERSFEIAPGVKMAFCWIPPGKATLGSPAIEADRGEKEDEHWYTAKGYWLAKYPVNQAEWKAVTGNNPSEFDGANGNAAKGLDTRRYPVENVSWHDCQSYLEMLNARDGSAAAFGKPGKFVLPHEDEWEYACRGGQGNYKPFYFGSFLNGAEANCDGTFPYGTNAKGPFLRRTSDVGFYAARSPHPWGLGDMCGNVWQWCENWHDAKQAGRALRGGAWSFHAELCRSAFRHTEPPNYRGDSVGFRVCYRPN